MDRCDEHVVGRESGSEEARVIIVRRKLPFHNVFYIWKTVKLGGLTLQQARPNNSFFS